MKNMQLINILLVKNSKLKEDSHKTWNLVKTATYYFFHKEKANLVS